MQQEPTNIDMDALGLKLRQGPISIYMNTLGLKMGQGLTNIYMVLYTLGLKMGQGPMYVDMDMFRQEPTNWTWILLAEDETVKQKIKDNFQQHIL